MKAINDLIRLLQEFLIVSKILPPSDFIRWISGATQCLNKLAKTRSLGALDLVFGESFDVLWNEKTLHFDNIGFGVFSEIYGHLCYAAKGQLQQASHILDLGANGGAFTIFALEEAPNAQVYAVEAQSELVAAAKHNVKQNGYEERAIIECAVVGGFYDEWTQKMLAKTPELQKFDIQKYISSVGVCDFLKCDIEGGEFSLFQGDLSWTRAVKNMVLEFHPTKGDVDELEKTLNAQGFRVKRENHSCLGYFYCTRD